jgi:hypothetical protein
MRPSAYQEHVMSQSFTQSRNPAELSKPVHRELSLYSLAASAAGVGVLALARPAEAQIIYTPAHETVSHNHEILIDLNHDGVTDVVLREVLGRFGSGNSLQALPLQAGNGIESSQIAVGWAADLRQGRTIGPSARFTPAEALMANYSSYGNYFSGLWPDAAGKTKYLGIRFLINGETHYGWARLNVKYSYSGGDIGALLTGYAYQTQPNEPILAGATGGGDAVGEMPSATPVAKPATLGALALGAGGLAVWRLPD